MQSFDEKPQIAEAQKEQVTATAGETETPEFATDLKSATKESRKLHREQRKADKKEIMDQLKAQERELKEQQKEAKKQLKEEKKETPELNILPQEKFEEESKKSEIAFRQEKKEVSQKFKNESKELNADFKAKKKALKQEIKEAKANIFGHKLRTPEEEKARLEKRIVKLQAKFMEMYGETPDENSSNEEANEAGDKVEQPLQVVEVNQWLTSCFYGLPVVKYIFVWA